MSSLTFTTKVVSIGVSNWRMGSQVCFLKPEDAGPLHELLARAEDKHHGEVILTVDLPKRKRSTGPHSQNHRLNGFISQFCDSTGNDFDDIKLYVKRRAMRRGLPCRLNNKGEVVYSKVDGEPLPISEADMSVEQCGWVISEIEQLAAENSITLQEE